VDKVWPLMWLVLNIMFILLTVLLNESWPFPAFIYSLTQMSWKHRHQRASSRGMPTA